MPTIAEAEAQQRALAIQHGGVIYTSNSYMKFAGQPDQIEHEEKFTVKETIQEDFGTVKVTKHFETEEEAEAYVQEIQHRPFKNVVSQAVLLASENKDAVLKSPHEIAKGEEIRRDKERKIEKIYENQTPIEKFQTRVITFYSPKSTEYAFTFFPGVRDILGIKTTPAQIEKQHLYDISFESNPLSVEYTFNTFVSSFKSIPGRVLSGLLLSYGIGTIASEVIYGSTGWLLGKGTIGAKIIQGGQTVSKVIPYVALGGLTYTGLTTLQSSIQMERAGVPREKIFGNIADLGITLASFSYGFKVGFGQGIQTKEMIGKGEFPRELIKPEVKSGQEKYSISYKPPKELVKDFMGRNVYSPYGDLDIGGYYFEGSPGGFHTTSTFSLQGGKNFITTIDTLAKSIVPAGVDDKG